MLTHKIIRREVRRGFTLMEVLVVVAILVVLAGTGGVIYMRYLEDSKRDAAYTQVKAISEAVEAYKTRPPYEYPASLGDLVNEGKLDQSAMVDPWGNPYQYDPNGARNNGLRADVWSMGPNRDQTSVIGNWPN